MRSIRIPISRFLIETEIRSGFAVEPERLSLLWLVADEATGSASGEEAYRIRGGAQRIAQRLHGRLGDAVRLGSVVTRIEDLGSEVRITTAGGELLADRVILTAPVRTWAAIEGLPPALRDATTAVSYARAVKTLRAYERPVWRAHGSSGDLLARSIETWDAAPAQPGEPGILLGYVTADAAAAEERRSLAQRAARLSERFDRVVPGSARLAGRARTRAWGTDPFARGAWIAYAPGELTAAWETLHRPHGRIHLAGEHTDLYAGYLEGAVRSGLRAADEVLA